MKSAGEQRSDKEINFHCQTVRHGNIKQTDAQTDRHTNTQTNASENIINSLHCATQVVDTHT